MRRRRTVLSYVCAEGNRVPGRLCKSPDQQVVELALVSRTSDSVFILHLNYWGHTEDP